METKNSKVMDFSVIVKSLMDAHENALRKKYGYNGPLITSNSLLVCEPNLDQCFSKESFENGIDEHGDTPIGRLIQAAIRIGIQQGIYLCSEEPVKYLEIEDFDKLVRDIPVMKQISELRKSRKNKS